jgi:hypothetical protein
MSKNVVVDGVEYAPVNRVSGTRHVVVLDRGWIFAGDLVRENGRLRLTRAIMVFKWEQIGFDGMLSNPKSDKVKLKPMSQDVDVPAAAELFAIPVDDNWGL